MAAKTTSEVRHRSGAGRFQIVATNTAYGDLCRRSLSRLPSRFRSRIALRAFPSMLEVSLPDKRAVPTIFVSRLDDLPVQGAKSALHVVGESKHLLFVENLPVEAMPARLLQLDVRNPHRLHLASERTPNRVIDLIYRLCSGITRADSPHLIVDAWLENERLVLLSPSFDRLAVPIEKLAKFIGTDPAEVPAFEIDEDGRFLHWPHADVHLGWEQFLHIVDPASALKAQQKRRTFNERYGAAIRALREEQGLKQSEIHGVTERHLRRVEHGRQAASKATLEALATAHGLTLDEYLKKLAERLGKGRVSRPTAESCP